MCPKSHRVQRFVYLHLICWYLRVNIVAEVTELAFIPLIRFREMLTLGLPLYDCLVSWCIKCIPPLMFWKPMFTFSADPGIRAHFINRKIQNDKLNGEYWISATER